MSGRLETGEHRVARGIRAPTLNILYKCPNKECENEDIIDAYSGPPTCMGRREAIHPPEFMIPQEIISQI